MTDLAAYRNLFRRTGVTFTEYTFPRIFSQPVYDFWHIPEDAVTGIAILNTLLLFDEKNQFIGASGGKEISKFFQRSR